MEKKISLGFQFVADLLEMVNVTRRWSISQNPQIPKCNILAQTKDCGGDMGSSLEIKLSEVFLS